MTNGGVALLKKEAAALCRMIEEAHRTAGVEDRFAAQAERVREAIRKRNKQEAHERAIRMAGGLRW